MPHNRLTNVFAPSAKNILLGVLLALLLWYDIFWPQAATAVTGFIDIVGVSPLSLFLEEVLPPLSLAGRILSLVLYLILCFLVLRLNEVFSFIGVRTVLPSFFCLVTGGVIFSPHMLTPGIIVALLVLCGINSAFRLQAEGNPKYAFNVGLLFFTSALFSFSSIWFIALFWIFAYICNVFSLRVFLASLLGAAVPVVYAVLAYEVVGEGHLFQAYVMENFRIFAVDFHFSPVQIIYFAYLGLLMVLSLINYLRTYSRENIQPRRQLGFICSLFAVTLLLIILSVPDSSLLLWPLVVFGSVVQGRYFTLENNRFTKILLIIYIIGSFAFLFLNR